MPDAPQHGDLDTRTSMCVARDPEYESLINARNRSSASLLDERLQQPLRHFHSLKLHPPPNQELHHLSSPTSNHNGSHRYINTNPTLPHSHTTTTNSPSPLTRPQHPPHRRLRPLGRRQVHPPQAPLRRVPRPLRLQHLAHDPRPARRRGERPRVPLRLPRRLPEAGRGQRLHRARAVRQQPLWHERAGCQGCEGEGEDLYFGY